MSALHLAAMSARHSVERSELRSAHLKADSKVPQMAEKKEHWKAHQSADCSEFRSVPPLVVHSAVHWVVHSADSRDLQSAGTKADTTVDLLVAATVDGMVGRTVAHSVA